LGEEHNVTATFTVGLDPFLI